MAQGFGHDLRANACFQAKSRESVTQPVECQLGQAVFPNQPTEVLGNHTWGKRRTINVGEDISGVLPVGLLENGVHRGASVEVPPNIERESTAYHEAGHAVAGFALKRAFTKVSIVPDDTTVGHCAFMPRPLKKPPEYRTVDSKFRNIMERRAMTYLAGGEAEQLFYRIGKLTGRVQKHLDVGNHIAWGLGIDNSHAVEALGWLTKNRDDNELSAYLVWLGHRVRVILQDNWAAVEVLADKLLEVDTILRRECIALIRSALDDRSKEIFVVRYFALPR